MAKDQTTTVLQFVECFLFTELKCSLPAASLCAAHTALSSGPGIPLK